MVRRTVGVFGLLALLMVGVASPVVAQEVFMRVLVNATSYGDRFFLLEEDGEVLLPRADFEEMGFRPPPDKAIERKPGYVSLRYYDPALTYRIENNTATLYLFPDPELFLPNHLDFHWRGEYQPVRPSDPSAYVSGFAEYWYVEDTGQQEWRVPFDVVASGERLVLFSDFNYTVVDERDELVRNLSHVTLDDPVSLLRLRLGDVSASSGFLGGAGVLGGFSLSRAFFMRPDFQPYPESSLSGLVRSPSRVEVYANGILVGTREVMPGRLVVEGLPSLTGSGEVELVVIDDAGNRETIQGAYYTSSRMLKQGLHDYSYNLGYVRDKLGEESFEYLDPALVGSHRYGWSDDLTLGLGFEGEERRGQVAPELRVKSAALGELGLSLAASWDGGDRGAGGYLDYRYISTGFSLDASLRMLTREFSNLSLEAEEDKVKWSGRAGIGYRPGEWGALSAAVAESEYFQTGRESVYTLTYAKNLGPLVSLNLRGEYRDDRELGSVTGIFVGINGSFDRGVSWTLDYASDDGVQAGRARLYRGLPTSSGVGFDLGMRIQEVKDDLYKGGGDAMVQYQGRHGVVTARYRHEVDGPVRYGGGVSTALSWLDGLHLSRPIQDSFALVRVPGAEGIGVLRNNSLYGTTDGEGELLVAGLSSYARNALGFELRELPMNVQAEADEAHLVPAFRSGNRITFPVKRLRALVGVVYLEQDGERATADFARLALAGEGAEHHSVVGRDGEIYLEEVVAGDYELQLTLKGKNCTTMVTVPELPPSGGDEIFMDIGEVTCAIP